MEIHGADLFEKLMDFTGIPWDYMDVDIDILKKTLHELSSWNPESELVEISELFPLACCYDLYASPELKERIIIDLELAAQKTMYHVTVVTGNKTGAGTDSDVFLQMFGEKDDSGEIQLKSCKSNSINKFEKDSSDLFYVECINLGPIQRLQIWHDATGIGSDWYVDKVKVDAPTLGTKRVFPCQEWLGEGRGDGTTKKELYPALEADEDIKKSIKWEIVVYTSDIAGAGTDAKVFIVLLGDKGSSGKINLEAGKKNSDQFFEKGSIDVFTPDVPDIGKKLFKAQIGHAGTGMGDGWHVDKVVARCLDNGSTLTYTFPCGRWLDRGEGDGQIEVDLIPESAVKTTADGEEEDVEIEKLETETYTIKVRTGNKFGAGTDANVYLSIFGTLGDSGERKLMKSEHVDKFMRNQTDTFTMKLVELGEIYKIVLNEDATAAGADWYVAYVNISTSKDQKGIDFPCEQWFSDTKGDKQTKRALYPKGKSTDQIKMAEKALQRGISFSVAQDGSKTNTNIEVAKDRTDIIYQVTIETGPDKGDGTSAEAYIILNTGDEKTEQLALYHLGHHDKFKPGQKQEFEIEHENVGELTSIVLGHKGVLSEDAWFVKSVALNVPTIGKRYVFDVMRWLAKDRGDRKIAVVLKPTDVHEFAKAVPHTITLHTADVDKSGTDGNLIVKFFGDNGTSDDITLAKTSGRFERASITSIPIEFTDVGSLMKLRLKLIGSSRKNYFCNKILLRNLDTDLESVFETNDWLQENTTMDIAVNSPEGGGLEKVEYKVDVTTSDLFACSTDANVYVKLYGELGDSIDLRLRDSKTHANKFERNHTDDFYFSMLSLGALTHCRVWHDDSGSFSSWHLNNMAITDTSSGTVYNFPCNKWLSSRKDDRNISRDLICSNPREVKAEVTENNGNGTAAVEQEIEKVEEGYEVIVVITNKKEAGTQHGLWFSVEGSAGSTDKMEVENKMGRFFKKGQSELFFFPSEQMEIGELTHIRVGLKPRDGADKDKDPIKQCHMHDIIVNKRGDTTQYHFACNHWLSLPGTPGRKSYRKLAVSETGAVDPLLPARVSASLAVIPSAENADITLYRVSVLTGDKFGAGTDANVFITMFGKTGDTGKRALVKAGENLFERNVTSTFDLECKSLGGVSKIIIEHDNKGVGASWHCDSVTITDQKTQDVWNFNCNEWIDKKKGDRQLFKVLWPVGRKQSTQRKSSTEKKLSVA